MPKQIKLKQKYLAAIVKHENENRIFETNWRDALPSNLKWDTFVDCTRCERSSNERTLQKVSDVLIKLKIIDNYEDIHKKGKALLDPIQNNGFDDPSRVNSSYLKPYGDFSKPDKLFGREEDLNKLKKLAFSRPNQEKVIRGWPGVGKTSLLKTLVLDFEVLQHFPDGVVWLAIGEQPNTERCLQRLAKALNIEIDESLMRIDLAKAIKEKLSNKQLLLAIDDVWRVEDVELIRYVCSDHCIIMTTRLGHVAHAIAQNPTRDIYPLKTLDDHSSLSMLASFIDVSQINEPCKHLLAMLENLPLAIKVAGKLLSIEIESYGNTIESFIESLKEPSFLLQQNAPRDCNLLEAEGHINPAIRRLLAKSTDRLNVQIRESFASLGIIAPFPATFDKAAIASITESNQVSTVIKTLIDHGLLEYASNQRYQMHSLLVMHAQTLLEEL